MIRALLFTCLLASPAAAQSLVVPPAVQPCTDRHLDPQRYIADLQGKGWQPVPVQARAAQIDLLNETFLSLVVDQAGPRADRLEQGRLLWAELSVSQMVFTTPDNAQVLLMGGGVNAEGVAQVRCWLAFVDGTRMDSLYQQLLATSDITPAPGDEQVLVLDQPTEAANETLQLYLPRPTPDVDTPARRAGVATLLSIAAEGAE